MARARALICLAGLAVVVVAHIELHAVRPKLPDIAAEHRAYVALSGIIRRVARQLLVQIFKAGYQRPAAQLEVVLPG